MKNSFLNALPVIAQALAEQIGVDVKFGASTPKTDGKTIFLPRLDSESPEARGAALGMIAHEGAHCRDSDFLIVAQAVKKGGAAATILGILEDIRIEAESASRLPGTKMMLSDMVNVLVAKGYWQALEEGAAAPAVMLNHMLYQLRLHVLGQEAFRSLAESTAKQFELLPAGMRVRLTALMYQVTECASTQDVYGLTLEIIKMIEEEKEKEKEKEQGEENRESEASQSSDHSNSDSSQSQGESQGEGGEGEESSESSSSESNTDEGESEGNSESSSSSADADSNASTPTPSQILESILGAGEQDAPVDVGSALKEVLGKESAIAANKASAVVPFPAIPCRSHEATSSEIDEALLRVGTASNALKVRSRALLQAKTLASKRSKFTGGS